MRKTMRLQKIIWTCRRSIIDDERRRLLARNFVRVRISFLENQSRLLSTSWYSDKSVRAQMTYNRLCARRITYVSRVCLTLLIWSVTKTCFKSLTEAKRTRWTSLAYFDEKDAFFDCYVRPCNFVERTAQERIRSRCFAWNARRGRGLKWILSNFRVLRRNLQSNSYSTRSVSCGYARSRQQDLLIDLFTSWRIRDPTDSKDTCRQKKLSDKEDFLDTIGRRIAVTASISGLFCPRSSIALSGSFELRSVVTISGLPPASVNGRA